VNLESFCVRSYDGDKERVELKMLDDGQVGYVYRLYIYTYRCRSVDQKSES